MKRYFNIIPVLLLSTLLFSLTSCEEDEATCGGTPSITQVSTPQDRTTAIAGGSWADWVIIQGANFCKVSSVKVNGIVIDLKEAYVTDSEITVQVPSREAPLTDNIEVIASGGTATVSFSIIQPEPKITSFNPVSGEEGDVIIIVGEFFDNLTGVKFADLDAEIVSNTQEEIQVKVPAGFTQGYIYVTTLGGTVQSSNPFGFRLLVYDDALAASWWQSGWAGSTTLDNTENVKRGTNSIKQSYQGGWGGFQVSNGGATISLVGYTTVKVSIYGGANGGGQVKLVVNSDYGNGVILDIEEGQWVDFSVPLSQLGGGTAPSVLNEIVIQEFSGADATIYVDDLGLL